MIGIRTGVVAGVRSGIAAGVSADELDGGADPLASVARDAASGWYFPATAGQWTTLLTVAGIESGGPGSARLCQEASGNLADSIGAVTLTQTGAGHLYQQTEAGFTRKSVRTVEGTVGQRWVNSTIAPDPNAVSTLMLLVIVFPVAAPAAARCLFANGGTLDCRLAATTGRITIINGASTTGTIAHINGTRIMLLQRNITASAFTLYSDLEKITGTFGAVASNPMMSVGGQTAAAAGAGYLYEAEFSGAAAEITATQAKSLITTMTGIAPPWTP